MAMASLPPLLATSSNYYFSTRAPAFLTAHYHYTSGPGNRHTAFNDADGGNVVVAAVAAMPPSKGEFYNDDELFSLLTIHQTLHANGEYNVNTSTNDDESVLGGGVHDWVLQTLKKDDDDDDGHLLLLASGSSGRALCDVDDGTNSTEISVIPNLHKFVVETIGEITPSSSSSSPYNNQDTTSTNQIAFEYLQKLLRDRKPSIRAIATDVDGTLLSGQYLHPITQDAVLRGIQQAHDESRGSATNKIQHFFPATGKSRAGAIRSLGPIIGPLLNKCPGVYIQGLYCVDREGNVIFEKRLSSEAIHAAEELVSTFNTSIVGYDGDELYTTEQTDLVRELSEVYGEPTVEILTNMESHSAIKLARHDRGLHKLLLMDDDIEKLALVRDSLEELAKKYDATVTQALPTMLELLPAGCSKADGVQRVCEALGIDPSKELLALGDAENDTGLLRMACIGVAVANACPLARDAADFIMRERHDEGGAGLAMNMFAFDE